jgi:hypothetical protein
MKWTDHALGMGVQGENKVLVEKPEGKRPLERPRFILELILT